MPVLLQHFTQLLGYIWVWLNRHVIAVYGSVSWHKLRQQSLQAAHDDHTTPAQAGHLRQSSAAGFAPDTASTQSATADTKYVDATSSHEAEFASAYAQHGYGYGYGCGQGSSSTVLSERQSQFPQLSGVTYLDHAAATLCSKRQLEEAHAEQLQQLMGNPHSQLPVGIDHSALAIEELRLMTLNILNAPAEQYEVVFTSGATAALKLVGEAFPWTAGSSCCAYLTVNHNSALGIRQQAAAKGATLTAVQPEQVQQLPEQQQQQPAPHAPLQEQEQQQQQQQQQLLSALQADQGRQIEQQAVGQHQTVYNLFIAPAECNMSGTQYDCVSMFHYWQQQQQQQRRRQQHTTQGQQPEHPDQTLKMRPMEQTPHPAQQQSARYDDDDQQRQQQQQQQRWLLLVDAAKACATHPPDCSACYVDMLVLSYYKIFGYPTGLGALVVRRSLLPLLQQHKAYFGGGTVEVALPDTPHVVRRSGPAGLEDGTLPFTAIAAARHGISQLKRLGGLPAIGCHTACLTWHLMLQLKQLRHSNGQPVAVLYCSPEVQQLLQGQTAGKRQFGGGTSRSTGFGSDGVRGQTGATEAYSSISSSGVPEPSVLAQFRQLQGPVVCFNLMRPDGSWVGHKEVGKLAAIHGICLRTGCFCNPGACAHYLGLSSQDLLSQHAAGHVCGDDHDLIDGRPNGAVRASFGWMSSYGDVAVLLDFVQKFFANNTGTSGSTISTGRTVSSTGDTIGTSGTASSTGSTGGTALASAAAVAADKGTEIGSDAQARVRAVTAPGKAAVAAAAAAAAGDDFTAAADTPVQQAAKSLASTTQVLSAGNDINSASCSSSDPPTEHPAATAAAACGTAGCLTALYLYPVKSCAPQQVTAWPIGPNGLLYDREWAVCGSDGQVLSQKRAPRLTQVRAEVDLQGQVLRLSAVGVEQQLLVPLQPEGRMGSPVAAGAAAAAAAGGGSQGPVVETGAGAGMPQQEVRVCGDKVCAQVLVGSVVGMYAQSESSVQTSGEHNTSSSSSSSSSGSKSGSCSRKGKAGDVGIAAGSEAAVQQWFTAAVGVPCKLVRQVHASRKIKTQQQQQQQSGRTKGLANGHHTAAEQSPVQTLGFANESQYLLVNQASVDYVAGQLTTAAAMGQLATSAAASSDTAAVDALQFRPNLVVSGFKPWAEDRWEGVTFTPGGSKASLAAATTPAAAAAASKLPAADVVVVAESSQQQQQQQQQTQSSTFDNQQQQQQALQAPRASTRLRVVGPCGRCDMVSIDQGTGQRRGSQLLSLLARERRVGGKLQFGVLLANGGGVQGHIPGVDAVWLHVGDVVAPVQVLHQ